MNLKKNPIRVKKKRKIGPFMGRPFEFIWRFYGFIACYIPDQTTNSETTNLEFYLFLSQFFDKINNSK